MDSKKPLVKEIDFGIACRIGNTIYVNKKLKKHPHLFLAIMQHEFKHTSGFTMKDLKIDINNEDISDMKTDYWRFVASNPSTWTEFLPCGIYDGKISWNLTISTLWIMAIGGAWLLAKL